MSALSELIIDGEICALCGAALGLGSGYPDSCEDCEGES